MFQQSSNFGITRDLDSTNSRIVDRFILPKTNLSGPPTPIIPNGYPGGLLYNTVDSKPYYSDGFGWYPLSGGGGNSTTTDAFIFYDPTNLPTGGGWGATGPSSNMDLIATDPQITTPAVVWSNMYNGGGNISLDIVTGIFTIVNSGLYKVSVSLSVIATAPVAPTTISVLLYGGTAPPLIYFATQTLSSNIVGFSPSGTLSQISTRMWNSGFQFPIKFNWFTAAPATFIFSPLQISFERIGDYNPIPPYP